MITRRDGLHYMDPWPPKDCIVGGTPHNHIELRESLYNQHESVVRSCRANTSRSHQTHIDETEFEDWTLLRLSVGCPPSYPGSLYTRCWCCSRSRLRFWTFGSYQWAWWWPGHHYVESVWHMYLHHRMWLVCVGLKVDPSTPFYGPLDVNFLRLCSSVLYREAPKMAFTFQYEMRAWVTWPSYYGASESSFCTLDSEDYLRLRMNCLRNPWFTSSWSYFLSDWKSMVRWPISSWKAHYSPAPDPFLVRWEWFRATHPRLVFDGAEDLVDGDLEWCEVDLLFVGLHGAPRGLFVDCAESLILILLWEGILWLRLLPLILPLGEWSTVFRVASSIWMYFWTRKRMFLILVNSCFTKCF